MRPDLARRSLKQGLSLWLWASRGMLSRVYCSPMTPTFRIPTRTLQVNAPRTIEVTSPLNLRLKNTSPVGASLRNQWNRSNPRPNSCQNCVRKGSETTQTRRLKEQETYFRNHRIAIGVDPRTPAHSLNLSAFLTFREGRGVLVLAVGQHTIWIVAALLVKLFFDSC